jgi:hypothetical protein
MPLSSSVEKGKYEEAFHALLHMSPTGGIFVNLSAPGLTVIAATITQDKNLLCVIS